MRQSFSFSGLQLWCIQMHSDSTKGGPETVSSVLREGSGWDALRSGSFTSPVKLRTQWTSGNVEMLMQANLLTSLNVVGQGWINVSPFFFYFGVTTELGEQQLPREIFDNYECNLMWWVPTSMCARSCSLSIKYGSIIFEMHHLAVHDIMEIWKFETADIWSFIM